MSFTDEDLKRLKECLHPLAGCKIGLVNHVRFAGEKIDLEALITRLEAAETILRDLRPTPPDHANYIYGSTREDLEAWRKACGK